MFVKKAERVRCTHCGKCVNVVVRSEDVEVCDQNMRFDCSYCGKATVMGLQPFDDITEGFPIPAEYVVAYSSARR